MVLPLVYNQFLKQVGKKIAQSGFTTRANFPEAYIDRIHDDYGIAWHDARELYESNTEFWDSHYNYNPLDRRAPRNITARELSWGERDHLAGRQLSVEDRGNDTSVGRGWGLSRGADSDQYFFNPHPAYDQSGFWTDPIGTRWRSDPSADSVSQPRPEPNVRRTPHTPMELPSSPQPDINDPYSPVRGFPEVELFTPVNNIGTSSEPFKGMAWAIQQPPQPQQVFNDRNVMDPYIDAGEPYVPSDLPGKSGSESNTRQASIKNVTDALMIAQARQAAANQPWQEERHGPGREFFSAR